MYINSLNEECYTIIDFNEVDITLMEKNALPQSIFANS